MNEPPESRPIRVLAVDHTAGVAPFRRKFAALAARPGVELTVFAPNRWIENYTEIRLNAPTPIQTDGYSLQTGAVVWPGYENRGFFLTGLSSAIRRVRPDILHLWEEPFSLIALQALWFRRRHAPLAKAIFFSSDNLSRDFHYAYRPSWFYARVERYAHRQCVAGTAVSQEVKDVLRAKGYRGPIEVIPHGLDLADYPERHDDGGKAAPRYGHVPPVIGYLGRLTEQKGVDTLLRAFAALPAPEGARPPTLAIVGDGPAKPSLVALASSLGLGARVHFLPSVPHGQVPDVLRAMDVLVLPSRTTPQLREQFGRVLIEAMASGCVVIGSSSGA
ncbi:MAG TPA: glycosyltransferase, partial [Candidatus Eisenbacteria bacterium]|nr:glycosyltransferase [Candidatus Eisenbacteria bacterium]